MACKGVISSCCFIPDFFFEEEAFCSISIVVLFHSLRVLKHTDGIKVPAKHGFRKEKHGHIYAIKIYKLLVLPAARSAAVKLDAKRPQ